MYLAKIEEHFTQKRGQGLILSPKDWQLARGWEQDGIPLPVVLRGINRSFEQADSDKQIRSLAYCETEIKNLWQEYKQQREGAYAGDVEADVLPCSQLMELASCLEASLKGSYPPQISEKLHQFKKVFDELSEKQDAWEIRLGRITKKLVCYLKELVSSTELLDIEAEINGTLKGYKTRMSKEAYKQTFDSLIAERLLAKHNLGQFSIYAD